MVVVLHIGILRVPDTRKVGLSVVLLIVVHLGCCTVTRPVEFVMIVL